MEKSMKTYENCTKPQKFSRELILRKFLQQLFPIKPLNGCCCIYYETVVSQNSGVFLCAINIQNTSGWLLPYFVK